MSAAKHIAADDADVSHLGLAGEFAAGDSGAAREVGIWIDRIVRYRSWRFRDPDNVVQEVTLRLLQLVRAGRFRGESSFKTFVHSVATHVCIDSYRRERRLSAREVADDDLDRETAGQGDPDRALAHSERFRTLGYVYQQLSEECRNLWRLIYFEHRRAADVAGELGISENATRVRVHRCLQRARGIVDAMQSGVPPGESVAT